MLCIFHWYVALVVMAKPRPTYTLAMFCRTRSLSRTSPNPECEFKVQQVEEVDGQPCRLAWHSIGSRNRSRCARAQEGWSRVSGWQPRHAFPRHWPGPMIRSTSVPGTNETGNVVTPLQIGTGSPVDLLLSKRNRQVWRFLAHWTRVAYHTSISSTNNCISEIIRRLIPRNPRKWAMAVRKIREKL